MTQREEIDDEIGSVQFDPLGQSSTAKGKNIGKHLTSPYNNKLNSTVKSGGGASDSNYEDEGFESLSMSKSMGQNFKFASNSKAKQPTSFASQS